MNLEEFESNVKVYEITSTIYKVMWLVRVINNICGYLQNVYISSSP